MRIEGKIEMADGTVSEFSIEPDTGWHQWGATTERLGRTSVVLDSIAAAVADHFAEDGDADEDEDLTPDFEASPDPDWMNP